MAPYHPRPGVRGPAGLSHCLSSAPATGRCMGSTCCLCSAFAQAVPPAWDAILLLVLWEIPVAFLQQALFVPLLTNMSYTFSYHTGLMRPSSWLGYEWTPSGWFPHSPSPGSWPTSAKRVEWVARMDKAQVWRAPQLCQLLCTAHLLAWVTMPTCWNPQWQNWLQLTLFFLVSMCHLTCFHPFWPGVLGVSFGFCF